MSASGHPCAATSSAVLCASNACAISSLVARTHFIFLLKETLRELLGVSWLVPKCCYLLNNHTASTSRQFSSSNTKHCHQKQSWASSIQSSRSHHIYGWHFVRYGPSSSVGIATDCELGGPGIESRWGEIFRPTGPTLGPTQPPVQWVPGLSRG